MIFVFLLAAILIPHWYAPPSADGSRELVNSTSNAAQCLPSDVAATEVVSATQIKGKVRSVTVAAKLKELGARCRRGKLVDARGKEIRFYRLQGCWGNPPDDYQEILAQQAKELAALRKRYNVIEMTCNPSGEMISRALLTQTKSR